MNFDRDEWLDRDDDPPIDPVSPHECDEHCVCCGECYQATGQSICSQLCQHAEAYDE